MASHSSSVSVVSYRCLKVREVKWRPASEEEKEEEDYPLDR